MSVPAGRGYPKQEELLLLKGEGRLVSYRVRKQERAIQRVFLARRRKKIMVDWCENREIWSGTGGL
jgi:hypothetical protein